MWCNQTPFCPKSLEEFRSNLTLTFFKDIFLPSTVTKYIIERHRDGDGAVKHTIHHSALSKTIANKCPKNAYLLGERATTTPPLSWPANRHVSLCWCGTVPLPEKSLKTPWRSSLNSIKLWSIFDPITAEVLTSPHVLLSLSRCISSNHHLCYRPMTHIWHALVPRREWRYPWPLWAGTAPR